MQKIQTIAVLATISLTLIVTACSKKNDNPVGSYTCTCIVTTSGIKDTVVLPETNIAKNTAQSACTSAQTTYTSAGSTATCTLK